MEMILALIIGGFPPLPVEAIVGPHRLPLDTKFYRELLRKRRCTTDDGIRLLLAMNEGADKDRTPAERLALLVRRDIIKMAQIAEINPEAELQIETLAFLLCRFQGIKGGVSAALFGLGPRTAYRECVNLGLIRANGQGRVVSGEELLSILARVEDHRRASTEGKKP